MVHVTADPNRRRPDRGRTGTTPAVRKRGVDAYLFRILASADLLAPGAELEEAIWVTAESAVALQLAPLTRLCVLPLAR